jgi:hypothetical protein
MLRYAPPHIKTQKRKKNRKKEKESKTIRRRGKGCKEERNK